MTVLLVMMWQLEGFMDMPGESTGMHAHINMEASILCQGVQQLQRQSLVQHYILGAE